MSSREDKAKVLIENDDDSSMTSSARRARVTYSDGTSTSSCLYMSARTNSTCGAPCTSLPAAAWTDVGTLSKSAREANSERENGSGSSGGDTMQHKLASVNGKRGKKGRKGRLNGRDRASVSPPAQEQHQKEEGKRQEHQEQEKERPQQQQPQQSCSSSVAQTSPIIFYSSPPPILSDVMGSLLYEAVDVATLDRCERDEDTDSPLCFEIAGAADGEALVVQVLPGMEKLHDAIMEVKAAIDTTSKRLRQLRRRERYAEVASAAPGKVSIPMGESQRERHIDPFEANAKPTTASGDGGGVVEGDGTCMGDLSKMAELEDVMNAFPEDNSGDDMSDSGDVAQSNDRNGGGGDARLHNGSHTSTSSSGWKSGGYISSPESVSILATKGVVAGSAASTNEALAEQNFTQQMANVCRVHHKMEQEKLLSRTSKRGKAPAAVASTATSTATTSVAEASAGSGGVAAVTEAPCTSTSSSSPPLAPRAHAEITEGSPLAQQQQRQSSSSLEVSFITNCDEEEESAEGRKGERGAGTHSRARGPATPLLPLTDEERAEMRALSQKLALCFCQRGCLLQRADAFICRYAKAHEKWEGNEERAGCYRCGRAFSHLRRRHHCRRCGRLCCAACSRYFGKKQDTTYITPDGARHKTKIKTEYAVCITTGDTGEFPEQRHDAHTYPTNSCVDGAFDLGIYSNATCHGRGYAAHEGCSPSHVPPHQSTDHQEVSSKNKGTLSNNMIAAGFSLARTTTATTDVNDPATVHGEEERQLHGSSLSTRTSLHAHPSRNFDMLRICGSCYTSCLRARYSSIMDRLRTANRFILDDGFYYYHVLSEEELQLFSIAVNKPDALKKQMALLSHAFMEHSADYAATAPAQGAQKMFAVGKQTATTLRFASAYAMRKGYHVARGYLAQYLAPAAVTHEPEEGQEYPDMGEGGPCDDDGVDKDSVDCLDAGEGCMQAMQQGEDDSVEDAVESSHDPTHESSSGSSSSDSEDDGGSNNDALGDDSNET